MMVGAFVRGEVVVEVGSEDTVMAVACVGAKVGVLVTTVGEVVERMESMVVGVVVGVAMTGAAVGEVLGVTLVDVLVLSPERGASTHKRRAKRASMCASASARGPTRFYVGIGPRLGNGLG